MLEFVIDMERVIDKFEEMTSDVERVQKDTLRKILEENRNAEYLLNHGLDGRTDVESFKSRIPVATYSDLEHYIQRIVDGDTSPILTGKPFTTISLSSGTSQGKPKFIPFNDGWLDSSMQIFQTSFAYRNREYPIRCGKALQFVYGSKQWKTKGGLDVATAGTNMYRSPQYKAMMKANQSQGCSPDEVIFGPDFHQSLYCHLLCGLLYWDEVQFIYSLFAHSIVQAFRTFEDVWEDLCTDIRVGVLSSKITVPSIRAAMSNILIKPDPELADLIHGRCSGLTNNWYGLIPTLFPNAKYIYGIMTGSMEPYLVKLRHYGGGLPLLSGDYGSSEGWIGANVNPKLPPEETTFCLLPNIGYFEFIPLRNNNAGGVEADPVGLTEVKIDEEYEILITNFTGFYRYRLGDTVKVKGFHNATPELQYICRRNLILTVNIDKTTEKDLQIVVETASKLLSEEKLELVDFTSHVDMSTDPGHYVIFWETNGEDPKDQEILMSRCCNCLDRSFVDAGYVSSRKVNAIGPLELRVLKRGTFQKVLNHFLGMGAAASQFKTPRFIGAANKEVLRILNTNVGKTYFSSAY